MSIVKKLAGETLIYGMGAILPKVLNFIILTPYLTNILTKGEYGQHGFLYAFVALMMVMATFRMETAFFRFANKDTYNVKNTFTTAFLSVLVFTTIVFIILLVFAEPISSLVNVPENPEFIKYFAWIILFDALAAPAFARLRIENKPILFSWIKIINVVANIIAIGFLLELCPIIYKTNPEWIDWFYDPTMELDYVFWANMFASFIVLLLLIKTILKDHFFFDKKLFLKMLKYAFPLIIVGITAVINGFSDKIFLPKILPGSLVDNTDIAGVFNGSLKIAVLMSLFTTAFNYAAEPFFFKNAKDNNKDNAYAKVALAFSAVGGLIFIGILLYIDVFKFLIGKDFREALDIVPILLMSYLILGLFYNFAIWYKISDKTYVGAIIASLGSVIVISLNFYLIPKIGYIGSAWATLVCYTFMSITAYLTGQKYHPISYPVFKILFNLLFAISIYFISMFFTKQIENQFLIYTINTGLILFYIGIIYKYEWKYIK